MTVFSLKGFRHFSFSALVSGIDNLTKYFAGDELVSFTLDKFSCALTELQSFLSVSEISSIVNSIIVHSPSLKSHLI